MPAKTDSALLLSDMFYNLRYAQSITWSISATLPSYYSQVTDTSVQSYAANYTTMLPYEGAVVTAFALIKEVVAKDVVRATTEIDSAAIVINGAAAGGGLARSLSQVLPAAITWC